MNTQIRDNHNSLSYCEQLAAPLGSTGYYSLLYADPKDRPRLLAIYAFRKTMNNILEANHETAREAQLGWWRDELERLSNHKPRHPLTSAFLAYNDKHIPASTLSNILICTRNILTSISSHSNHLKSMYASLGVAFGRLVAQSQGVVDDGAAGDLDLTCANIAMAGFIERSVQPHYCDGTKTAIESITKQVSMVRNTNRRTLCVAIEAKIFSAKCQLMLQHKPPRLMPIHKFFIAWRTKMAVSIRGEE